MDQEKLKKQIEECYGFKRELITEVRECGTWFVRFMVNDIIYTGKIPYYGAKPLLFVEGYNARHWKGIPITEDYYKQILEGNTIYLKHRVGGEEGSWERMNVTFPNEEAAKNYIRNLEEPEDYTYDVEVGGA